MTLEVNAGIDNIITTGVNTYTISDADTAANVGSAFTSGVDEITIDFGGKEYSQWGLSSIDLSGFGVEDKLIISRQDGVSGGSVTTNWNGSLTFNSNSNYMRSSSGPGISSGVYHNNTTVTISDRFAWNKNANPGTQATLASKYFIKHWGSSIRPSYSYHTHIITTPSGNQTSTYTIQTNTITFSYQSTSAKHGQVLITGLPPELPWFQIVFV
jgi:hypothetical protein